MPHQRTAPSVAWGVAGLVLGVGTVLLVGNQHAAKAQQVAPVTSANVEKLESTIAQLQRRLAHLEGNTSRRTPARTEPALAEATEAPIQPEALEVKGSASVLDQREAAFWQDSGYTEWSRATEAAINDQFRDKGVIDNFECHAASCRLELRALPSGGDEAIEEELIRTRSLFGKRISYFWTGDGAERHRLMFITEASKG